MPTPLWEYRVEHAGPTHEAIESFLDRLGGIGWELVSWGPTLANPTTQRFVFKRPLQAAPEPALTTPWERWRMQARPGQLPPIHGIDVWDLSSVLGSDRGVGRTRAAAEYVAHCMNSRPGFRVCVLSPNYQESYLLPLLEALPNTARRNASRREITNGNGSKVSTFQLSSRYSDDLEHLLRGRSFDLLWTDEVRSLAPSFRGLFNCPVVIS